MMDLRLLDSDEGAEEVTPETPKICEVKNFTDREGRTVIGYYPVNDMEHPEFQGAFMVPTNMGPVRLPIEFNPGVTLEECFNMFDACAEATIKDAQKDANERSRIVTPDQLRNTGKIFTP